MDNYILEKGNDMINRAIDSLDKFVDERWVLFLWIARIVLTGVLLWITIPNLTSQLQAAIGYAQFEGVILANVLVPFVQAILSVAAILILVGGKLRRLGLLLFMVFLIPVTLGMHQWWRMTDPTQWTIEIHSFQSNIMLFVLALGLFATPDKWPSLFSIFSS
jgi:putative oxidoreductase